MTQADIDALNQRLEWRARTARQICEAAANLDCELIYALIFAGLEQAEKEGFREALKLTEAIAEKFPKDRSLQVMHKAVESLYKRNHPPVAKDK